MSTSSLNDALFDAMLTNALRENIDGELAMLPQEDELAQILSFSPAFEQKMKKLRRSLHNKRQGKQWVATAKRIASIAFFFISMVFGMLMLAEPVRASVQNLIIEWFDQYTTFSGTDTHGTVGSWSLGYLPEGFEATEHLELDSLTVYEWKNSEGKEIHLECSVGSGSQVSVDNENTIYSEILVNGETGHLFINKEAGGNIILIWSQQNTNFVLIGAIPLEEIVKIANSIK